MGRGCVSGGASDSALVVENTQEWDSFGARIVGSKRLDWIPKRERGIYIGRGEIVGSGHVMLLLCE